MQLTGIAALYMFPDGTPGVHDLEAHVSVRSGTAHLGAIGD